jgi:Calcineurin-like phosphoesterase
MKTSILSINSFIGILSSSILLFLSIASISNAHAATSDFNFAAVGDWGCNSNADATVKGIANTKTTNKLGAPELVLGLGDYSYQPTANCWLSKVASIADNMKITIGNHENSAKTGFNQYKKSFGLTSNAYYSFDFQNVHFIIMNTQTPYIAGSSQYNFIKSDLAKAANKANTNWIIVVMHEPFYTSPTSCKIKSCQGIGNLRDIYHPLFDTYKVDLVLGAHLHDYQRSFLLEYNSASSSKPIMTSKIPSKYNDPK